jgi:hypothetical protein
MTTSPHEVNGELVRALGHLVRIRVPEVPADWAMGQSALLPELRPQRAS